MFVLLPTLLSWGVPRWVRHAHLPGSQMIPALQSVLALLALKLTGRERISHVMDVCTDPGFALFAGLNVLPKTTALRMLIENCIAENMDFFHLDALSSAIALQVDFDLWLTLLANGLYRVLARRLSGFEAAHPKQIFRRFLNAPARVRVTATEVHVQIRRCTHHPILLASGALDERPEIPWWGGRRLRVEIR